MSLEEANNQLRGYPDEMDDPRVQRDAGDTARDQGDWEGAELAYKNYLDRQPEDSAIWMQYGHSLKEQGKLADAEAAYRMSLTLTLDDADGYLQLGHVLKLQNRIEEAGESYAHSFEIKPSKSAHDELEYCGRISQVSRLIVPEKQGLTKQAILFEVDDLIGFLYAHVTVSGIQRVQLGILESLLRTSSNNTSLGYVFIKTSVGDQQFWRLDPEALRTLVDYCINQRIDRTRVLSILRQLEQTATLVQPSRGQCYFIMGAFWGFNGDATRYAKLKTLGVSVGLYVYDLIPISHPEYCDASLVSDFALSLGDGLAVLDFVLTISEYSASEVRRYIAKHNLRKIPVESVLLAHVLSDQYKDKPQVNYGWPKSLDNLRRRPFVLMVSTIEPRKNHAYLISVWKLLIKEGIDPPDLVFVGRHGWRVNDFMEQLRSTQYMDGLIHVLHDLSDAEMQFLYENCMFTAFPSFVEGWGLPVGESLAHGQICVASDTSSIPEVGGDLVDYIDPFNTRNGVDVVRRLIADQTYRDQRKSEIRVRFKPRTWEVVTGDLLRRISDLRARHVDGWQAPLLLPGEIFQPSDLRLGHTTPANYPARPIRLILSEGWHAVEAFGVWMRGAEATLRFATELKEGTEVVAYMRLAGAPTHAGAVLTISSMEAGQPAKQVLPFPPQSLSFCVSLKVAINQQFSTRLLGRVGSNSEVEFKLLVDGNVPFVSEEDRRRLSVGLMWLAYAPRTDTVTRADIVDALEHDLYSRR